MLQARGIQVGMFIMLGYDGEEVADIEATVDHLKRPPPTCSSPRSPIRSRARSITRRCLAGSIPAYTGPSAATANWGCKAVIRVVSTTTDALDGQ